jgi:hypothetical protein
LDDLDDDAIEEEPAFPWMHRGPPRWFRSNAGGMTLEEVPSRLTAIRNEYALVIDYIEPDELDPLLRPYFNSGFGIEIRMLHKEREEHRRQWLFRDEAGTIRLNAVFRYVEPKGDSGAAAPADTESPPAGTVKPKPVPVGFIETFNEEARIIRDHLLHDDGKETLTTFYYNENIMIAAVTETKDAGGEFRRIYTDNYRYNRFYALRNVERTYHESLNEEPVRLAFPYRSLDAAADTDFIRGTVPLSSDFFGGHIAEEGDRVLYDTDSRGRVLSQTMVDPRGIETWTITHTWLDDRIISIQKIEGSDEKITEYEYNSNGDRIIQRDWQNGVLERQIRIDGNNETEELFINGVVVLRAYWVDGRKIREERVRR